MHPASTSPAQPAPTTAALELRDVAYAYDRRPVLHHVNLTVPLGNFTAIIGPNGGGKSTLLKLTLGQIEPLRGTVRLLGRPPRESRHRVGYLPQSASLDPAFPVTVRQVVGHGRLHGGWRAGRLTGRDHDVIDAALRDVDSVHLADRPLATLSGGQRQRVLIARALATEPEMLVLDEPAASLDPQSQIELYDLLSLLARRLTIIVVSHHVSLVSRHVEQVVCLHDGHLHLPTTAEISEDLRDFFPDVANMVLVRHDHDDCPLPGHGHE